MVPFIAMYYDWELVGPLCNSLLCLFTVSNTIVDGWIIFIVKLWIQCCGFIAHKARHTSTHGWNRSYKVCGRCRFVGSHKSKVIFAFYWGKAIWTLSSIFLSGVWVVKKLGISVSFAIFRKLDARSLDSTLAWLSTQTWLLRMIVPWSSI